MTDIKSQKVGYTVSSVLYDNEVQIISGFFDFTITSTGDICEKIAPDLLN